MTAPTEPSERAVSTGSAGPVGHRGIRAAVLRQLKRDGEGTAASLATALDCALNTVRNHLKEFEHEGLVSYDRTHHGVGAPAHAYRLSAQGHSLFPDGYAGTVAHLLDHLMATQGRDLAVASLQLHYDAIGGRICTEVAALPQSARGETIARRLDEEGFMATWQATADGGTLIEHNCPHRVVAERFPEVCAAEEVFLARAFGGTVVRESRIAAGCGCCRYRVTFHASPPEDAT